MIVDNTSLLVALKQKPHPSDAGSEIVCERSEERGGKSGEFGARREEGRARREEVRAGREEGCNFLKETWEK